jgi:hypothetical protein
LADIREETKQQSATAGERKRRAKESKEGVSGGGGGGGNFGEEDIALTSVGSSQPQERSLPLLESGK